MDNKVCKFRNQVHLISIQDDDISKEENSDTTLNDDTVVANDSPELQIFLHALLDTASHATFPLFLHFGNQKLVALVDSGSTASFMDPTIIEKSSVKVVNHDPLKVIVANGNVLWTHAMTNTYQYTIQGQNFSSAIRVLELQGYDIILGCDWIYDYNRVGLNLKTREFIIEKEGNQVKLLDETLLNKNFLVTHKKMKKLLRKGAVGALLYVQALQMADTELHAPPSIAALLQKYDQVFAEPTSLSPQELSTIRFLYKHG
jgi:hypothetical protein